MLRNERMWKWHEFVGICLCDLEMIKASKLGETVCKRGKKPVVFSCIHYLQVAICTVLFFSMTEVYFHISTFFTPFPIRKEKWHEENADEKKFCSQKRQTHSAIAKFQRFQMLNFFFKYCPKIALERLFVSTYTLSVGLSSGKSCSWSSSSPFLLPTAFASLLGVNLDLPWLTAFLGLSMKPDATKEKTMGMAARHWTRDGGWLRRRMSATNERGIESDNDRETASESVRLAAISQR